MDRGIVIENFQKSLDVMEAKVSALENELASNKLQILSFQKKSSSSQNVQNIDISNEKSDILLKQIQLLKEENKNLADDLREWKSAYNDKIIECEKNREKYLNAQQLAEEYRRQLDVTSKDTARKYEEQASANLVIVNERFKEQLGELGHLPFVLEAKQLELQDCYSKLKVAEKTISALSQDLETCIVKYEMQQKTVEHEKSKNSQFKKEIEDYQKEISEWKTKFDDTDRENQLLMKSIEKMKFMDDCLETKTREVHELLAQIDILKNEHSKRVLRIKERADIQRRSFQAQISGLEQELVQLRATLNIAQQEREEIKLRMQNDLLKMEKKFNDAQLEIQNLKSHVEILKASYTNVFENIDDDTTTDDDDDNINNTNGNENGVANSKNCNNNNNSYYYYDKKSDHKILFDNNQQENLNYSNNEEYPGTFCITNINEHNQNSDDDDDDDDEYEEINCEIETLRPNSFDQNNYEEQNQSNEDKN